MSNTEEYMVSFGKIARNLNYEDTKGFLRFVFDCEPADVLSGSSWNLYLCKQPLDVNFKIFECKDEFQREWLAIAFKRVKEFVISCGYILIMD